MDPSAGVFIQRQVEAGTELILGIKKDPSFGYFLLFGAGGLHAEVIRDRNVALFLDSYPALLKVIGSTTMYKLVENKKGVLDVVDMLIGLINKNPIFSEIEINPLIVTKDKVWAVDGKASLL
jgi:succinyl-CoA synthetase beta subunit